MRFKIVFVFLLLCIMPTLAQDATPGASDCKTMPKPDHREVLDVMQFGDAVLDIENWRLFYVEDKVQQAYLEWEFNETSVVFIKHWIYVCGAPNLEDVLAGFDQTDFDIALSAYAPYERTATCKNDGMTLIEFIGVNNSVPYKIRIWYEAIDEFRFREVRLHLPRTSEDELDELSAAFYPDLTTCAKSK